MNWREGLRRGRSHVIFVIVLAIGGATVVQIEDNTLEAETGRRPAPRSDVPTAGAMAPDTSAPRSRAAPAKTAALANDLAVPPSGQEKAVVMVQAGAYATRAVAQRAGERMLRNLSEIDGVTLRVEPFRGGFRARFAAQDRAAARMICERLTARGDACWIVER